MKFERVELYHIKLDLAYPFETSFGRFTDRDLVILRCFSDIGSCYSEAPSLVGPFYSYETTQTTLHILRDFLLPAVLGKDLNVIGDLHKLMEFVRGHNIAKSGLDTAFYHLMASSQGQSLSHYLGGTRDAIEAGISIGIEPTLERLRARVDWALEKGYKKIKIKIKPGWDFTPLQFLREQFGDIPMMADANSAYTLNDVKLLQSLDQFNLLMLEQPLGYDDIYEHSILQKQITTPICLDESINSFSDARLAVELEACRIINIKLSRVGGLYPSILIHDLCQQRNIAVWSGGMVESGIGKADSTALSTLPNFKFPADIAPSDRYFVRDIVSRGLVLKDGYILVPTELGVGVEVNPEFLQQATVEPPIILSKP